MTRLVAIELRVRRSCPFLFDLRKVALFHSVVNGPLTVPSMVSISFAFHFPTQSRQCTSKRLECCIPRYMTALSETFQSSPAYRCRCLTAADMVLRLAESF